MIDNRKPQDFTYYPLDSVLQNSKCETVAKNIMIVLSQNGNKWRRLPWSEYKVSRIKDGQYDENEQIYFNKVIDYTVTPQTAVLLSDTWNRLGNFLIRKFFF